MLGGDVRAARKCVLCSSNEAHMRNAILTIVAVIALCSSGFPSRDAMGGEDTSGRLSKKSYNGCHRFNCAPRARCGIRCRTVCPDRYYPCSPLYGAYGPGGARYWGAYTYVGWGRP
jgi:hypothetical protein